MSSKLKPPFINKNNQDFFKPATSIVTRMNTFKIIKTNNNTYKNGCMKTNLSIKEKDNKFNNLESLKNYHIKTLNSIEKLYDNEEKKKYRIIDRKKNFGIDTFNPLCKKSIAVRTIFNSDNISNCLVSNKDYK